MNAAFVAALQSEFIGLPTHVHAELMQAAAWTRDGRMDAHMQLPGSRVGKKGSFVYNMTGSALRVDGVALNRARDGKGRRAARQPVPGAEAVVSVRTVDLNSFLRARFCAADFVWLKCDIEGAEFELLEHLLETGAAGLIDEASIEWHLDKRAQRGRERVHLKSRQRSIAERLAQAGVRLTEWKL